MVLQFQQYYETNNEFVPKNYNYNECECLEITPETSFNLMIALTAGCMLYSFVKSDAFPETMIRVTYKAISMYTKMNTAYNKLTSYFLNKYNKNNNNESIVDTTFVDSAESYTNYEIRVIKNGVKYEQFETMKLFKKSNYLGNPNDYCDSQDDESHQSNSFNGCDNSSDSQDDDENQQQQEVKEQEQEKVKLEEDMKDEKCKKDELFIMKHNKQNNTIQFKPYDFIMQTLFFEKNNNTNNKQNKNYTKLYRKFTENDYSITTKDHVISKAGMIICSLELKGVSYDIDISFPYNFNVVGNIILDYTFLSWYMMKEYTVVTFTPECEYTLTCISNEITTYKLGNSSGLLVNLNEYEIINV
jgi:hypothetical protein